MAVQRSARLAEARPLGPDARLLEWTLPEGEALGFAGGQYVIVNSGVPLADGRVAKRAYSVLSSDREQARFQIAVRRIGSGPGSNFLHGVTVGTEIPFSGPWGKFLAEEGSDGSTVVFATDTGITAALGLLRSLRFEARLRDAEVVWFVESEGYFVPPSFVRERVPPGCGGFRVVAGLPVGHPERAARAREILGEVAGRRLPAAAYLSGDGLVLEPLRGELVAAGLPEERIRVECFFNAPAKKSGG
ncbi:MAG: FAD-dependent oxidoreductase [Planctomycetales bacterium]|nr:FAD-dependent oxidoreductase [Planctomycetales bacterium]